MDTDTLILMAILISVVSVFVFFNIKNKPQTTKKQPVKTTKDELESLVKEQVRTIQDNYLEQIQMLKKDKSNLQNKVNRIEGLYNKLKASVNDYDEDEQEEDDDLLSKYEIDPQKATEYAQKFNLNVGALNNPALQHLIWEKIKENKDTALLLGIIRPKGVVGQNTQANQSTGSIENIYAELQKTNQFA